MAISALYILDSQGNRLIFRDYRGDVDHRDAMEEFVKNLNEEEDSARKPVFEKDGLSFIYIRKNNIYRTDPSVCRFFLQFLVAAFSSRPLCLVVAVTNSNTDATVSVMLLYNIVKNFEEYFDSVEEESIRDNFVVIYELLDEMADFGYPQTTEPSLLKEYIMNESQKLSRGAAAKVGGGLTNALTGGWFNATNRVTKSYNRNEVWIDVVEKVNLMVSAKGSVLQHDVQGQVKMKAQMNGIPVVHLGFNNKFNFTRATEEDGRSMSAGRVTGALVAEDFSFHPCVDSAKVESDRAVRFIPPDGEFQLMTYRLSSKMKPLIWVESMVQRHAHSRIEYIVKVKAQFKKAASASDVKVIIPCPPDADSPILLSNHGSCTYTPETDSFVWSIPVLQGGQDVVIRAQFGLPSISDDEDQSSVLKRPIAVKYELPTHTVSGIAVRYLNVSDAQSRGEYTCMPWIRYITSSGEYQFRMSQR